MNEDVSGLYATVISYIAKGMNQLGFKARGGQEFVHKKGGLLKRLALSMHRPAVEQNRYAEAFVGFNFSEVEALAAELQAKKPRPGFMTCSLNIGLLTPSGTGLRWPLLPNSNAEEFANVVSRTIADSAVPFWDEFSSVDKLLAHLESGDFRVCRGIEWPWRRTAAYCLLGKPARAIEFLQAQAEEVSGPSRIIIETAIRKIAQMSKT